MEKESQARWGAGGTQSAVLIAEEDVHLATSLSKSLESEGYEVHTALDEESALAELQRQDYKLIILDLNFGRSDGLKLLEKLHSEGLPVIVLGARNRDTDRIASLEKGADDYVVKPFSSQELAARANALLRIEVDPSVTILRVEDLELDPATRKVTRAGHTIRLSVKEFHLLHLLMRHAGHAVTRQELLREVWGPQLSLDTNLVDVYVNYLRRKIENTIIVTRQERIDERRRLIHTVRGTAYRIGQEAVGSKGSPPVQQSPRSAGNFEPLTRREIDQVESALENPKYLWRTIAGISKELQISPSRVESILERTPDLIKSSTRDGRSLYTTRKHYKSKRGTLGRIISALSDAVR